MKSIKLSVIPARDDPPFATKEYQEGLWDLDMRLSSLGLDVSSRAISNTPKVSKKRRLRDGTLKRVKPSARKYHVGVHLGAFAIKASSASVTALAAVLGAWLNARYGRKVRLKVGQIEAEAQSVEEVERLLESASLVSRPKKKINTPRI